MNEIELSGLCVLHYLQYEIYFTDSLKKHLAIINRDDGSSLKLGEQSGWGERKGYPPHVSGSGRGHRECCAPSPENACIFKPQSGML